MREPTFRSISRFFFLLSSFILAISPSLFASPDGLTARLDKILERSGLLATQSRFSIKVVSVPDGRVLYERNPDLPLNPASNIKLVTMATALKELGPGFTFRTEFYSDGLIDGDGRIKNLWIKGYGDPLLVSEELQAIMRNLRASGLKKIDGFVFLDETYFDRYDLMTYVADVHEKRYRVFTNPLSFDFNRTERHSETVLKQAFQNGGIRVQGPFRKEAVPSDALLLFTHSSPPLPEILRTLGKFSNNFTAEQVLKAIAAKRYGPPGSTAKGLNALREYLESLGIPRRSIVLDNGSGLTRLSKVSASDFVRVLFDLYTAPWREAVIPTLSIAGRDGTMGRKLTGPRTAGRAYAKTGTLNGVSALSGYLFDPKRTLAFSFLFNDFNTSLEQIAKTEEELLVEILDESP